MAIKMLQILDSVPDATRACFLFIARKRSPTITFSHRFGIYIHHYRGRWILVPIVFIRLHIGSGLSGHNPGKRLWNRLLSISFHSQGSLRCVCLARQAQGVYKWSMRTHDTSVVRRFLLLIRFVDVVLYIKADILAIIM